VLRRQAGCIHNGTSSSAELNSSTVTGRLYNEGLL